MALNLEEVVGRADARWVSMVERLPRATLAASGLVVAVLGVYAALHSASTRIRRR